MADADVPTMPCSVFKKMLNHPLTGIALQRFVKGLRKAYKESAPGSASAARSDVDSRARAG